MIRTSEDTAALSDAIAKAQADLENVGKAGNNPHFKSRYATLPDVLDEVRGKFAKHGIAILQAPSNGENGLIGITTRLSHKGQWIESTLYLPPMKFDAQGVGSVLTYGRRYALMAMAGIGADDDDGEAAVGRPAASATRKTNGENDPTAEEAKAAGVRIREALTKADKKSTVDDIVRINAADLKLIKELYPAGYENLMSLAQARSQEFLAGA